MKKILVFMLTIFFVISNTGLTSYSLEKQKGFSRENIYINDMNVPFVKVGDNNYIKINDLKHLGFEVSVNEENKQINIYQNPNLIMQPIKGEDYKSDNLTLGYTEYKVNINGCSVEAKKLKEDIVINIDSFIKVKGYDFEKSTDSKDNSCDINIKNSDRFLNSFTKFQKTEIHLTKKGNNFYSKDDKIGFIKDSIEWISLDYIKKLINFDKIKEGKNKDELWIYLEKGDCDVEIQVEFEHEAYAESGRFYMDLSAIPLDIDDELYIPLVDSIQLFNLEITRDDDLGKKEIEKQNTSGVGNSINGLNIIKNNEWLYYINNKDFDSLHRAKHVMSEDIRLTESSVTQFYICDNQIFYIGYGFDGNEKGLYKSSVDGTNKVQIVSGDVSFLNVLGDELYFCEGSYGGKLYKIDKNGKNKTILLDTKITYPNISNGWIYYINTEDNNSIYRFNLDSSYNVKINNRPAKCLNVDSRKVYFSDSRNSYFMNHDGSFKNILYYKPAQNILISENNVFWVYDYSIYKQSKDNILGDLVYEDCEVRGIGLEGDKLKILQEKQLTSFYRYDIKNKKSDILDIKDGYRIEKIQYPYIYYKKNGSGLMQYNMETKESKTIVSMYTTNVYNIIDDWIYYLTEEEVLYRVKADGSNKTKILEKDIYDINIDSSGIYYLVSMDGMTKGAYCRVDLDGTNKKVLLDDLKESNHFFSRINKDYIYYRQKDGLYRVKKDGTEKKKIIDKPVFDFKIIDDHIYYRYEGDLYSITSDGREDEKIIDDVVYVLYTKFKDAIFYVSVDNEENSELYKYDLISKKLQKLPNMKFNYNSSVYFASTEDNYLVINVLTEEGPDSENISLYLIDMESNEITTLLDKIDDCDLNIVLINGDYVYYSIYEWKSKLVIE